MNKDIRCTFYRDEKTLLSFLFPTKFDNYNVYMRLCFYLKDVRRKVKLISHLRLHLMLAVCCGDRVLPSGAAKEKHYCEIII